MPTPDSTISNTKIPHEEFMQRGSMPDPLLSVREGAALLNIAVPTFWRWVANGTLPKPVKLGGMSRWPKSELIAVVENAKALQG